MIGCSPIDDAIPLNSKCEFATTATLDKCVWNGPTHWCWNISPVTLLSTLFVRNLLEPTVTSLNILYNASFILKG